MQNMDSNSDDIIWLSEELKQVMGCKITINSFGLDSPVLTGIYYKGSGAGSYYNKNNIRFFIKFCKNEFLRIQIVKGYSKNDDVINTMEDLIKAVNVISIDGTKIGLPLAMYEVNNCLTSEYSFNNKKDVIAALQAGTSFEDNGRVVKLNFTRNCDNCNCLLRYTDITGESDILYCAKTINKVETTSNNTCVNHVYIDDDIELINNVCKQYRKDK